MYQIARILVDPGMKKNLGQKLFFPIKRGNFEAVKKLIERGADLECINSSVNRQLLMAFDDSCSSIHYGPILGLATPS